MQSRDTRRDTGKAIDFLNIQEDEQAVLAMLFEEVAENPDARRVYQENKMHYLRDTEFRLNQSVLFYDSVNNPGTFKIAVTNYGHLNRVGRGAFSEVFNVTGTVHHDGQRYVYKVKTNRSDRDDKPRVVYRLSLGKGQTYDGRKKITFDKAKRQASFMKDKAGKAQLAHFHGKDVISDDAYVYIIARKFEGKELFDFIVDDLDGLPQEKRLKIAANLLRALKNQIHDAGLIHRDIKPENILINPEDLSVNIIDVGLSVRDPDDACCGSSLYISPEIIKMFLGEKDRLLYLDMQSDIYNMGIVIGMVLGMPFTRQAAVQNCQDQVAMMSVICYGQGPDASPVDYSQADPIIREMMRSLLAPDKGDRAQTDDLEKFALSLEALMEPKWEDKSVSQVGMFALKTHSSSDDLLVVVKSAVI